MIQLWQQILRELLVLNRASGTSTCRTILANNLVVETVESGECFGFVYEDGPINGPFSVTDKRFSEPRKNHE